VDAEFHLFESSLSTACSLRYQSTCLSNNRLALSHLHTKYIVHVTIRGFRGPNDSDWRPQVLEVNPTVALEAGFSGETLFADEEGNRMLMGMSTIQSLRVQTLPQGIARMEIPGWKGIQSSR